MRQKQWLTMAICGAMTLSTSMTVMGADAVSTKADSQNTNAIAGNTDLGTYVVTASRILQRTEEVPANVTVVTPEAIERGNFSTVSQALESVNVNIARSGNDAFPILNGDDRVLVLVNGRKMNWSHLIVSGVTNAISIDRLPIDNVERIEVVRGPNSSLYGQRAVAGVINIITKAPQKGSRTTVGAEFGTWGQWRGDIRTEGGDDSARYMFSYSKEHRGNYQYKNAQGNTLTFPNSDYNRQYITTRLDKTIGDDELSFELERSHSVEGASRFLTNPFNGTAYGVGDRADTVELGMAMTYNFSADKNNRGNFLRVYRNSEKADAPFAGTQYSHDLVTWGTEYQKTWTVGQHNIVSGASYIHERVQEDNDGSSLDKKAFTKAIYVEDQWNIGANWSVGMGTRYEHHDAFGGDWASHVSLNRKLGDNTTAYISYGQAVNTPTLKMLYANTPYWKGNPDLKQETANTVTVGVNSQISDKWYVSGSVYSSAVKNALEWGTMKYENIAREKRRGVALNATYKVNDNWTLRGGYAYTNIQMKDQGSDYTDYIYNARPHEFNLGVGFKQGKWDADLNAVYVRGQSRRAFSNTNYLVLNLGANYHMTKDTKIYVKGYNLTNKSYENYMGATAAFYMTGTDVGAYAMPKRHFVMGVQHSF